MGSSECHTDRGQLSAPPPERNGAPLPEFEYEPVPAHLETFRQFAHERFVRMTRAHLAWNAIVCAPQLWEAYSLPDPFPDTPIAFLDERCTTVDLRSILDRLIASSGDPTIWYEHTPRRIVARPATMEFIWQISTRLVRQAAGS